MNQKLEPAGPTVWPSGVVLCHWGIWFTLIYLHNRGQGGLLKPIPPDVVLVALGQITPCIFALGTFKIFFSLMKNYLL